MTSTAPGQRIPTTAFPDQRPGTSGLRKKTRVFMQPGYLENFVQAALDAARDREEVDWSQETLVVGGDGRFHNAVAIGTILAIAVGNGVRRVLVGRGGLLSTPAMSAVIRRRGAAGGLLLTASHNPGGPDADFGIKYNGRNGGPAPEALTERIHEISRTLEAYRAATDVPVPLDALGETTIGNTEIAVIDPLVDYTAVMEELFDFAALRALFAGGFRLCFDAMHAVTGPYAHHIFEECLGAPRGTVVRGEPLEDFGGLHPDPNQVHAAELVARMAEPDAPDLGAASDGDGDRNMILGRGFFVTPGDSLAIIAEHARCIPGYAAGLDGVARSMPTSTAVDRVAAALGIPVAETPTGWKFFGNLMDAGLCTLCGEESFGTGSNHVREKDGVWAVLCWLSILAHTGRSVEDVTRDHWGRFGRSYYRRCDYEALESDAATAMLDDLRGRLETLVGRELAGSPVATADDFAYRDPVDGSVSSGQGVRIVLQDGSRVVYRLSGTGTDGATLRLYLERYRAEGGDAAIDDVLAPLAGAAVTLVQLAERCGRDAPTVVT